MEDFTCEYSRHQCELKSKRRKMPIKESFKRMLMISEKNFWSLWFLRSKGTIEVEYMRQKNSKDWCVVHPFSLLRLFWELFMVVVLFFTFFVSLIRLGFLNAFSAKFYRTKSRFDDLDKVVISVNIDFYLTFVWLLDALGNFRTGYFNKHTGKIVMKPRMIFKNYILPGFLIDFSTSFPVDYLILKIRGMDAYSNLQHHQFVILQFYNIYRFVRLRNYIKYCCRIKETNCYTGWGFRFTCAIFVYCILLSISTSLIMVISEIVAGDELLLSYDKAMSWAKNSHVLEKELPEQLAMSMIAALHQSIGISSAAERNYSNEDYIMSVISCIIGRVFWLYSFVKILEGLTASQALKVKLVMILLQCKEFLKRKDVPVLLRKRVNRFYLYRFQAHYFRDRTILSRLPESLRDEISLYTCHRLIHNTEVFQSLPKKVLANLGRKMNREMYFPNDVIIRGNTYGESVYFICSGTVAVTTLSDKEICLLHDGDFFGEIALIFRDRRRIATVTAVTITEVYRLEYSDYMKIIEVYPDVYYRLEKLALERFKTTFLIEGGRKLHES